MTTTYSLHKITDAGHFGFSPDDYSRFKFGDEIVAEAFGISLAEGFIEHHLKGQQVPQMVVVSSPYSFIPTATFAMKNYFVFHVNRWLATHGHPVLQETKVHRTITYKDDYGELDAEQRLKLIGNDSFHIDRHFLIGKKVIFLDDIKITGGHERMILKMVDAYDLSNDVYMLYFAELQNKNIHPNIENYLNYHFVKSIFHLEKIIQGEQFFINTRIVKYILNYDFDSFCIFLQNQSDKFVNLLYNMALGNGYHTIEAYQKNLNFIKITYLTENIKAYNMAINLQKGQRQTINAPKFTIGLGWDANASSTGTSFDLDASIFVLGENKKILSEQHFIFYNNLVSPDGSVEHTGDNLTGDGGGDDEQVKIDLSKADSKVTEICVIVTIHDAENRRQNFGQVRNSFVRIFDPVTNEVLLKYELEEDFSIETAVEFGRIYKRNDEWKFEAVGVGMKGGLQDYLNKYN